MQSDTRSIGSHIQYGQFDHLRPRIIPHFGASDAARSLLRQQPSQAKIVHHILHILDAVLDAVASFSQSIILQVQYLEAGMHVFDELADLQWSAIISQSHAVAGETCLYLSAVTPVP